MSGTYEWTTLDNSFCLERSLASPPIDVFLVKTTMAYYNSLSTCGASPLCEWIDGPLSIVNSWIELHVPNGRVPDRRVPTKDIFIPFIVYGYDAGDGCHLIESFNFSSERTKVDFTRLSAPSIRHQGGRKFLSEIRPQSAIVEEDTEFERTALSFYLQESYTFEHINKFHVKTTMDFYNSLSKNNTSPLYEWVDDPHGLVNSWIELRVPNRDSFLLFTVCSYDDHFHLIESVAFKSLKSLVDLTLLPSGSIRQPGDRVFLSEILPQSDIVKEVTNASMPEATDAHTDIAKDEAKQAVVDFALLPSGSIRQPGDLSEILPHSDIVKEVTNASMPEAADAHTDIAKDEAKQAVVDFGLLPSGSIRQPGDLSEILPHSDIVKEASNANMPEAADAQIDRIRRQYLADVLKKKDDMVGVLRNLTLETQQRDWENQQKEKKEQRRLKKEKEKSKKEQNKKK